MWFTESGRGTAMKYGAIPEQLTDLGTTLKRQVAPIDTLMSTVTSALDSTTWEGPARDRFQQDWNGTFRKTLDGLKTALEAAGQDCVTRSQDLVKVMGAR